MQLDAVVPPDLGKEPTTILVFETPRDMVNNAFEDVFAKYYTGTIELISIGGSNGKYSDTKKYRYFFQTDIKLIEARGFGNTRVPATYEYTYTITDRQTNKTYGLGYGSDSWKNLLKKYVKKMEEVKQSNEKK